MSAHLTLRHATFTPAEAARITGVSTTQQRDWRRRGFLPHFANHARFDAADLATLLAMRLLAERGIGPARTAGVVPSVALRIAHHAAKWKDAYSGQYDDVFGATWGEKAATLNPYVPSQGATRLFVWAHDDGALFTDGFDGPILGRSTSDPILHGAIIVLDLEALGAALQERIGTPFLHVIEHTPGPNADGHGMERGDAPRPIDGRPLSPPRASRRRPIPKKDPLA
jgi:hypothetical protein